MNRKIEVSFGDRVFGFINYFIVIVVVSACIYPFLNVVAYSFSSSHAIISGYVTIFPLEFQTESYRQILLKDSIWSAMRITVTVTILATALGLFLTVCVAYALSKKYLKGRNAISMFILFTMYFSGGIIPIYLVVKDLGLINTMGALILPSSMSVFNFIIMRSFFMQLPESLEEAAILDGCNEFSVLTRIVLPLSLPIIATIGLFYAVNHWNSYFGALMYITDPIKYTLQLKLRQLLFSEELNSINASAGIAGEGFSQNVMPESLKAASIVITTIPIVLVYPWLQKYFVKGTLTGSIKG